MRHRLVWSRRGADYAPRTDGRPRPDTGRRDRAAHRGHDDRGLRSPLPALPRDERRRRSTASRSPSGRSRSRRCGSGSGSTTSGSRNASSGCVRSSTPARSTMRSGAARSCSTSASSSTTSGPSSPRRSSTRSSTRVLRRTYVHNDFAFVRAAISTEYIESEPPIYRSYYPDERGLRAGVARGLRRLRLEPAVRGSRARRRLPPAGPASSTSTASWPPPEPELPAAGARLGVLPQQGRLRDREDRQRQCRDAHSAFPCCTTTTGSSSSTRSCSTTRASRSSSRSRGRTSWSTWTCRPATSTSCRR